MLTILGYLDSLSAAPGEEVAVKVFAGPVRSAETLLRFTQERLLRVDHANLVASRGGFDDGDDDDDEFF